MMNEVHLGKMNEVSFRQLSAYSMTNCVEDKVMLVDSLSSFPCDEAKKASLLADFIALLFCTDGCLEINMDGKHYKLYKGDILFCSRGVVLYEVVMSTSCKGKMLCLSWECGQKLFLRNTCRWDSILQLRHNPLLRPNACEQELYRAYYQLFAAKLDCCCYVSDIDSIFQSFLYDLYWMTDRCVVQKSRQKASLVSLRQEELFKRFITLLKEKHSHEHFCSFYAEQLCVTPKYLSAVVKKVSGKSVSQWIDIYLVDQIKFHLRTTSLTIVEIADKLNFSNSSFFGKYVKMHTGESPMKLRRILQ